MESLQSITDNVRGLILAEHGIVKVRPWHLVI